MPSKRTWCLVSLFSCLAVLAAACLPGTPIPITPTTIPSVAPATDTAAPPPTTAPPTAAPPTAAPPTAVPTTAQSPATPTAMPSVAPSSTAAPATATTGSPATAVPGAIPTLAPGQAITVTNIDMLDANSGWATGGLGNAGDHVLRTADGGHTWHDITPPAQPAPNASQPQPNQAAAYFVDANQAWVVYGNFTAAAPATAVVWHTTDGGQTWTGSTPIDLSTVPGVEFFQPSDLQLLPNGTSGWFIAHLGAGMNHDYFTVFKTDDGNKWIYIIDPTKGGPQSCHKTGLHFINAQTGWLTGDCQGVAPGVFFMRSDDTGATWQNVALPAPASQRDLFTRQDGGCGTYNLHFFDAQTAKVSVSCLVLSTNAISTTNFVYSTADAGQTWTSSPSPARSLTFLNSQVGWALGTDDPGSQPPHALSQTQDGGQTWTTVKQLAWTGQLDFIDAQNGWAVAVADQAISLVKTADAGHTWQDVHPKMAP